MDKIIYKLTINGIAAKCKNNNNRLRYVLIFSSILLLFFLHFVAIPFIVSLYIILSIINNILKYEI